MAYVAKPEDGIAWVTGASSGLGRAVALKLAERGWTVAATARNAVALETLVAGGSGGPGEIVAFPGDVTKGGTMGQLVPRIEKKHGPIALALLAAGEQVPVEASVLDRHAFERSIEVNLLGMTNCLAPLIEVMRPRRRGQITLLAGLSGHGGLPTAPAYGPAKAALINLAESLHGTLGAEGLRLQIVSPGSLGGRLPGEGLLAGALAISFDEAAERLIKGLERPKGFQIAFPLGLRLMLRTLSVLPYPIFFRLAARLGRSPSPPPRLARRSPRIRQICSIRQI